MIPIYIFGYIVMITMAICGVLGVILLLIVIHEKIIDIKIKNPKILKLKQKQIDVIEIYNYMSKMLNDIAKAPSGSTLREELRNDYDAINEMMESLEGKKYDN